MADETGTKLLVVKERNEVCQQPNLKTRKL